MSDKLFTQEELETESEKLDLNKARIIANYQPQLNSMSTLINALETYQLNHGKESNVYYEILDLKAKVVKNKEALEDFLGAL